MSVFIKNFIGTQYAHLCTSCLWLFSLSNSRVKQLRPFGQQNLKYLLSPFTEKFYWPFTFEFLKQKCGPASYSRSILIQNIFAVACTRKPFKKIIRKLIFTEPLFCDKYFTHITSLNHLLFMKRVE